MNNFHSIVDRRDYFKSMGLWAFGLEDTIYSISGFHDIDEIISYGKYNFRHLPWWVKELEYDDATTEIDWEKANRFDFRHLPQCHWQGLFETKAWVNIRDGPNTAEKIYTEQKQRINNRLRSISKRRDELINHSFTQTLFGPKLGKFGNPKEGFLGPQIPHPKEIGLNSWVGTHEEASTLIWQIAILFGASDVSFVELNPKTSRNLVSSHDFHDGKPYVFEDTEKAFETGETSFERKPMSGKRTIPNRCFWMIHFSLNEIPRWLNKFFEDSWLRYAEARQLQYRLQGFIKGLGYQAIGPCNFTNNLSENVGVSVMGGEAELGRNNLAISPALGSLCGEYSTIITDLPLAPTKPINAGIRKYCHSCKICAESCPGGAISRNGNPNNEISTEPSWEGYAPFHRWDKQQDFERLTPNIVRQDPGKDSSSFYKHWYFSAPDCQSMNDLCGTWGCGTVCIFNKGIEPTNLLDTTNLTKNRYVY